MKSSQPRQSKQRLLILSLQFGLGHSDRDLQAGGGVGRAGGARMGGCGPWGAGGGLTRSKLPHMTA